MKIFTFTYIGEIRGQGRPRFSKFGAYKDKKDRDYENAIREAFINSGGEHFGDAPIILTIDVYRALPKSRPQYVKEEHDVFKPDSTNIAKSVEDALNGLAWNDDKQIFCVVCCKHKRRRVLEHMDISIEALTN